LALSALAEEFLRAGEKKEQAAERQRKLFEVRRIALEVQAVQDVQFDLSLLLAAALGQDYPEVSESLGALLSTTQSHPNLVAFLQAHTSGVEYLAFSPDGHTLASASSNIITLWDVYNPQAPRKQELQDHTGEVKHLAFSLDGHTLASASLDKTVILWDMRAPQYPREIQALQGHIAGIRGGVCRLAFSPDGHTLASIDLSGTIILWDVRAPQASRNIQTLQGCPPRAIHLAFSPNGHTLTSASRNGTIILWDLDPASLARKACRIAGRNMTREEWRQYMDDKPYRKICEEFPVPGGG
jgi:WD40 repeat protein